MLIGSNVPHYWHLLGNSSGLALQCDFPLEHGIWTFREAAALRALTEAARRGLHLHGATATFARQFLLHVGKPFSIFRNQVRLQAVCHALRDTNEPVGNIALSHGFNQLSFFNRLFRRELGISPTDSRGGRTPRDATLGA